MLKRSGFLQYYVFDLFEGENVVQGIFGRHGGVSPIPWNTLNLGGTVGDERSNVIENRRRIFEVFDRAVDSIFDVWQVHSADVICVNAPRPLDSAPQKADAIITDRPRVTLFMRFADCVPIFLYDPVKGVVGMAHAGWKGTLGKIAAVTVKAMKECYGSAPADILAGIGPSIGPDHYEVGAEVVSAAEMVFSSDKEQVLIPQNGRVHLDLWQANLLILKQAGVRHIQVANICTACNIKDWYSHRGEGGRTGRFGALLGLSR